VSITGAVAVSLQAPRSLPSDIVHFLSSTFYTECSKTGCPVVRKINIQQSLVVSGKFWNVALGNEEEDQLYRSCEQWI